MRLIVLTTISLALIPSVATAQSWQDWVKTNPTYGTPPVQSAPAPPPSAQTKPAPTSTSVNKYPPELKRHFIGSCVSEIYREGDTVSQVSQAKAFCGCIVNKSEAAYTLEQFLQTIEYINQTGAFPRRFEGNILTPCRDAARTS
jgi:hypothetical protein